MSWLNIESFQTCLYTVLWPESVKTETKQKGDTNVNHTALSQKICCILTREYLIFPLICIGFFSNYIYWCWLNSIVFGFIKSCHFLYRDIVAKFKSP